MLSAKFKPNHISASNSRSRFPRYGCRKKRSPTPCCELPDQFVAFDLVILNMSYGKSSPSICMFKSSVFTCRPRAGSWQIWEPIKGGCRFLSGAKSSIKKNASVLFFLCQRTCLFVGCLHINESIRLPSFCLYRIRNRTVHTLKTIWRRCDFLAPLGQD